ncbi:hypothetical protein GCM10023262_02340 [Bartonella pachyuromydis]|uniref:Uncharacterized protein n=1 Tax=Bartonella pachyuromydis TaxID=931097 RepID=A0ABP8VBX0_9HYPH
MFSHFSSFIIIKKTYTCTSHEKWICEEKSFENELNISPINCLNVRMEKTSYGFAYYTISIKIIVHYGFCTIPFTKSGRK